MSADKLREKNHALKALQDLYRQEPPAARAEINKQVTLVCELERLLGEAAVAEGRPEAAAISYSSAASIFDNAMRYPEAMYWYKQAYELSDLVKFREWLKSQFEQAAPKAHAQSLREQLMAALDLTEADFHKEGADLYIRAVVGLMPWLRNYFEHWTIVQGFRPRGPSPQSGYPDWLKNWPEGYLVVPHQ